MTNRILRNNYEKTHFSNNTIFNTFMGTSLQAQINNKVNLRFEEKVHGW
jgi:hypothetical protein